MFKISEEYKFWVLYLKIFQIFSSKKKIFSKNWGEKFEKSNFLKNFQNKLYFIMSNLNSECLQLSFDVHIVHVSQKLWIFKNYCTKSRKIFAVKLSNFDGILRKNYRRYDGVQRLYRCIKMPALIWDHLWMIWMEIGNTGAQKL